MNSMVWIIITNHFDNILLLIGEPKITIILESKFVLWDKLKSLVLNHGTTHLIFIEYIVLFLCCFIFLVLLIVLLIIMICFLFLIHLVMFLLSTFGLMFILRYMLDHNQNVCALAHSVITRFPILTLKSSRQTHFIGSAMWFVAST